MKKILLILIFWLICNFNFTLATNENWEMKDTQINYYINIKDIFDKQYKSQVSINTEYKIDLTQIQEQLIILYPENNFEFNWNISWATSQSGGIFNRTFKEKWIKELELNIYEISKENDEETKKLIFNKNFEILVYEKSLLFIFSSEINENDIKDYINFAKKDWIFIYEIWPINKTDIELINIVNNINNYEKTLWLKSDFITVWWWRDFIFNILSKINREIIISEEKSIKYNIVSISPYNITILESYLRNFLSNKDWLNKLILLNERSKFLILTQNIINNFIDDLTLNQHDFIDVNLTQDKVWNLYFISKFINILSNLWYSTNSIYIFLIIPIILTIISFFKHFVWLSPIWSIIPLFITILFFKLWLYLTLWLIFFYLILNLLLSIITNRYNLLYTPKINFILIINLVFFIILLNISYSLNIFPLNLTDILYFVIFILISEKFINIIISKDILEYKNNFLYTLVISLFCFWILEINTIKILILAYPEIIILLIPINFLIWRFTWLRITEYFRFREIIKNIEE